MQRRVPATVALSLLLVLAGCTGGIGGGSTTAETSATTTTQTATVTETATETATPTATETATPTPTPEYTTPQTPNRPTETADGGDNHVQEGKFTNKVESENGSGYSDFDVQIIANTSWRNIDPPEHGDVEGEPYALVLVNGELVERSPPLKLLGYGHFYLDVHPGALTQFEPGTLEVKVLLMDKDSAHDDVYGTWTGTIEYGG